MQRALLVTAALVAAVAVWIGISLPPRPLVLDASSDDGSVAGVLHVHTNRSDGLGDADAVAAAAARARLAFVVMTDHGDGTRPPDPPTYRHGVLCLEGIEVSTTGGHYVALDLGATPYPLGGEPRDVIEDVHRLGGFGIAAHPDSPKHELAWRDWTSPIDGLELLNLDTEWRMQLSQRGWQGKLRLLDALLTYPFRPSESIGDLLTTSADAKAAWASLSLERTLVGVGATDAHARLEIMSGPGGGRIALPIPGYESSFRAVSVHVIPTGRLTGDAAVDEARIIGGLRRGQLYTVVDAWASAPRFTFTGIGPEGAVEQGASARASERLRLRVTHNGGDGFLSTLFNGTEPVSRDRAEREFEYAGVTAPGAYRVEIRDPRHPDGPPWVTSNPIYVRPDAAAAPPPSVNRPPAGERPEDRSELFDGRTVAGWTVESDPTSLSAVAVESLLAGPVLRVRYGLSGGASAGQFGGVAVDTLDGAGSFDRVTFKIRGERPMRLSVQARADVKGGPPERWQRSIYVDDTERTHSVFFDDMTAVGTTHTATPPTANIRNLMFIVDTTNTKPGASGNLWLRDVRMER